MAVAAAAWTVVMLDQKAPRRRRKSVLVEKKKKKIRIETKVLFSSQQQEEPNPPPPHHPKPNNVDTALSAPGGSNYLWKLGAGSVIGGVVIKYGSILFPGITSPNLTEALIMISTPMLLSVLLLIRQSYVEDQQTKDP